ncbi:MAG: hypothetical protein ACXADX_17920, partial [Candidatus Hodarchaeales archaeon]
MKFTDNPVDSLSARELSLAGRAVKPPKCVSRRSNSAKPELERASHSWEMGKLKFPKLETHVQQFW